MTEYGIHLQPLAIPLSFVNEKLLQQLLQVGLWEKKEHGVEDKMLTDSGNLGSGLAAQLSQNCSGNQNY